MQPKKLIFKEYENAHKAAVSISPHNYTDYLSVIYVYNDEGDLTHKFTIDKDLHAKAPKEQQGD